MNQLRNRLIAVFLAATLVPLAATLWITTRLLEESLSYASTEELDQISQALERVGRAYYQRARESLREDAAAGKIPGEFHGPANRENWPLFVRDFADAGESERFTLGGKRGETLYYLVREREGVRAYTAPLAFGMTELAGQISQARQLVHADRGRDLHRGFTYTWALLAAIVWITALLALMYLAHRISRPIRQLTAGLSTLAAGKLNVRVPAGSNDEVGRALDAFNAMAGTLEETTERLITTAQLASWQTLARKMAHEVKNSLTPIRLTVEEMVARHAEPDRAFVEQAAQIVVDEVETLERRVRAFSEFAAEPSALPAPVDINAALEERVAFLRTGHPDIEYTLRLDESRPVAFADGDLVKGILVNLLENAADAAGSGGKILATTSTQQGKVYIEVHDSGPGLTEQARRTLFQPSISFKKRGMGLGLSIARRSALLSGGDIQLIEGELGGAAFRVLLPAKSNGTEARSDRR